MSNNSPWCFGSTHTGEDQVQQDSTSSVPDAADAGKVNVQDQETDAAEETGHADGDAVVAGVGVVVEDAEQTLAADVDVALVHDAAEHHHGENLRGKGTWAGLLSDGGKRMSSHRRVNACHSSYAAPRRRTSTNRHSVQVGVEERAERRCKQDTNIFFLSVIF